MDENDMKHYHSIQGDSAANALLGEQATHMTHSGSQCNMLAIT